MGTIDAPTKMSDFSGFINPEQSAPIFERAARSSVVQQLARQVPLGFSGKAIPVVTSRPTASWTGEGVTKHKTKGSMALKTITPKKLTAIMVESMEVVRANPGGYVTAMRNGMAEAFAVAFDRAALHDEGGDGTAGAGPFDSYVDQTTKTQEIGANNAAAGSIHSDFVGALRTLVTDQDASARRYRLNGWAIDDVLEPALWGALDSTGRPIYTELPIDANAPVLSTPGRLLNRPSFMGEGVASFNQTAVVGYGGDWSQTAWGVVGGISYRTSTETSVTIDGELVSCFENNLIAFLAEAEYGFLAPDPEAFVKLTNIGNSPVTSS
jgi:HK97 family phage major capsid protein